MKRTVTAGTGDDERGKAKVTGYIVRYLTDKEEEVYNWISFFEV